MLEKFAAFLMDAATRFSSIARRLRGQIKPAELHADAWIVAAEIGAKRGKEINFADPADRELVLSRLYWSAKDQRDWRLASAHSINDDREGTTPWADRLAAPASETPLEILLNREASTISESEIAASYTQAAAYNIALDNFKSDRQRLCAHLLITLLTHKLRTERAYEVVRRQHSLFTGLQTIESDFVPLAGQLRATPLETHFETAQAELHFG